MSDVYQLESVYPTLQQPGVTTGLRAVGYSAQYNGVQVQVWGNNPAIDTGETSSLAQAGLPLIHGYRSQIWGETLIVNTLHQIAA